jgi:hypothetical protein
MALSPDGARLAVTFQHTPMLNGQAITGRVEVVDLGTGATSTSRGTTTPGSWPGVPSWADGETLTVPWWYFSRNGDGGMMLTAIHRIDASRPGGVLVTTGVTTYRVPVSGLSSAEVTAAGRELLAPVCGIDGGKVTYRLTERSAATGHLIRVLIALTAQLDLKNSSTGMSVAVYCTPPSADASGQHVLIDAVGLGRIDNDVYTRLPGRPADSMRPDSAW